MIGGEFEIVLSIQREFVPLPDTYYYASGRTALYQILRSLGPRHTRVWMPDWLCHTMVEAAERAKTDVVFYELNRESRPLWKRFDRLRNMKFRILDISFQTIQADAFLFPS